jgi:hypothetical protein
MMLELEPEEYALAQQALRKCMAPQFLTKVLGRLRHLRLPWRAP